MPVLLGTVLAASFVAAISDVRTRRIPNALVGALFVAGLLENSVLHGWRGAAADVAIVAVVLAAGTVLFAWRLISGGDVKLLAAAAGALAYPGAVWFVLATLLCGGLLAVAFALANGKLRSTFANVKAMTYPLLAGAAPARPCASVTMPYALAIFCGALCTALSYAAPLRLLQ